MPPPLPASLPLTHLPQIIPVAQLTLFKNFSVSHLMFFLSWFRHRLNKWELPLFIKPGLSLVSLPNILPQFFPTYLSLQQVSEST